jgi:hypothetical protein
MADTITIFLADNYRDIKTTSGIIAVNSIVDYLRNEMSAVGVAWEQARRLARKRRGCALV